MYITEETMYTEYCSRLPFVFNTRRRFEHFGRNNELTMISQFPMIESSKSQTQTQIRNTLLEKLSAEERSTLFPSMFTERVLRCCDCAGDFVFTVGEQEF
ncbi:MAG TPA: hypothetical protein EYM95_19995, partial [Candidatus Obscuribacterales bacterium]|nr:hypothetical protein [Candidatus Obscuribacterales bacterium]